MVVLTLQQFCLKWESLILYLGVWGRDLHSQHCFGHDPHANGPTKGAIMLRSACQSSTPPALLVHPVDRNKNSISGRALECHYFFLRVCKLRFPVATLVRVDDVHVVLALL